MYLSEDFITSVKRRCNVPTSQVTFSTTDFLALGDEETRSKMIPLILKTMEEFYVTIQDNSIVSGTSSVAIPYRAISMALRDVQIGDTLTNSFVPLERLNPEDLYMNLSGNVRFNIQKNGFYLQGNSVILYPAPVQTGGTIRLKYYMRPNSLVPTANCGLITNVNAGANQVSVSAVPSNITTSTTVDFIRAVPGFECTAIDQTINTIAAPVITFASSLPSNLQVGDYVCQSGQTCVVQVPVELQPLLFQYVVVRILAAQGDQTNLKAAVAELESLEKAASLLLAPRVSGKVKRVVKAKSISRWV